MSTTTEMSSEITAYREEIWKLNQQLEKLEVERENLARRIRRGDTWIREQLDTLAVDVDTSSAPASIEQWRRCLTGMLRGDDWRHGTWR